MLQRMPLGRGHNFARVRVIEGFGGDPQAKLRVSQPGDQLEMEADRVADQVMQMAEPKVRPASLFQADAVAQRQVSGPEEEEDEDKPAQAKLVSDAITPLVQRQMDPDEDEEEEIQMMRAEAHSGSAIAQAAGPQVLPASGSGYPLDTATRAFMEPRFGHDFGQVRVHADSGAAKSARAVNARAYTLGSDIVFGAGQYAPGTAEGDRLLAHELTHVVQQKAAGTSGLQRAPAEGQPGATTASEQPQATVTNRPARPSDPVTQMANLLAKATNSNPVKGRCYSAVKRYIKDAGGYGDILDIYADERFAKYQLSAVHFDEAVDANGAEKLGLKEVGGIPPDTAAGTILVIQGNGKQRLSQTHGDISVISGVQDGLLICYNDGRMELPAKKEAWESGNYAGVLKGMYQPVPRPVLGNETILRDEDEKANGKLVSAAITPLVQRQIDQIEDEESEIQKRRAEAHSGSAVAQAAGPQVLPANGSGHPLDPAARSFMAARFGYDFSRVRAHTDAQAAESAWAVNARAYTLGQDIVFGAGQYAPGTAEGKRLLAHELTHVVQQTGSQQKWAEPREMRQVRETTTTLGRDSARGLQTQSPIIQRSPGTSGPDPINEAIRVLKNSPRITSPKTALDKQLANSVNLLRGETILGVFSEERERTGPLRQIGEYMEVGTTTYGRGAMGELAFNDVEANFPTEKTDYAAVFGAAPSDWIDALKDKNWAVFYTAAYLFLSMAQREKVGRSQDTQMRLGIALYHGGRNTVAEAQTAAAGSLGKKVEDLTWDEIAVELRKSDVGLDIIDYVDGVVTHNVKKVQKDFTFDVKAQLVGSTKFQVGEYGTIKVTCEGNYDGDLNSLPADKQPPPNYWVVIGGEKVKYETGKEQTFTWNNLRPGEHILRIYNRYLNGTIPLKGKGNVEVRF
jgi:hypothetical protein